MKSGNNREVSAQPGPRKPSSDSDRGRKRDRSVLTTTVGGSVCRDQSKDVVIDFKKPRCSSPVGGSGCRDRSKSLIITFKKPRLPKRKLRAKKVPSKGAAPPAANVTTPTSSLAPPTPSMAPPTPSSIPPTPSSAPPTPLTPPTPPLAPPTPSLAPPTPSLAPPSVTEVRSKAMWTKGLHALIVSCPVFPSLSWNGGLCSQWYSSLRDEWSRQQDSEEHLQKQQDFSSLFRDTEESGELRRMGERLRRETIKHARNRLAEFEKISFLSCVGSVQRSESGLDEGKVKQRIVQLLRRDERSRQQDSEEHLQKQQDLSSLFRDMEESGELWRTEERVWRPQRSTSLCASLYEDLGDAIVHFLVWGDEARLRKERQRLYRFQELLEQWSEAFTRGKHGVSFRVGECLKDVLAEVHEEISFLSWVESVQRSESGDERSRQQDSEEHLQKQQDLNSLFSDMEESGVLRSSFPERLEGLPMAWRLPRYSTIWILNGRSFENFIQMGGSADQKTEDPTGVSSLYHTGRFCQSSSGKTRRSLSVRNTRKYLRRLHTRTAGGALRRGPQPDCKLESRLSGSQ